MQGVQADYYKSVQKYRDSLSKEAGVSDAVYARRLAACLGCNELENGVCGQCGCYVEMRAAAKKMNCPKPGNALWLD